MKRAGVVVSCGRAPCGQLGRPVTLTGPATSTRARPPAHRAYCCYWGDISTGDSQGTFLLGTDILSLDRVKGPGMIESYIGSPGHPARDRVVEGAWTLWCLDDYDRATVEGGGAFALLAPILLS